MRYGIDDDTEQSDSDSFPKGYSLPSSQDTWLQVALLDSRDAPWCAAPRYSAEPVLYGDQAHADSAQTLEQIGI